MRYSGGEHVVTSAIFPLNFPILELTFHFSNISMVMRNWNIKYFWREWKRKWTLMALRSVWRLRHYGNQRRGSESCNYVRKYKKGFRLANHDFRDFRCFLEFRLSEDGIVPPPSDSEESSCQGCCSWHCSCSWRSVSSCSFRCSCTSACSDWTDNLK